MKATQGIDIFAIAHGSFKVNRNSHGVTGSIIHGFARRGMVSPEYKVWAGIRKRCLNKRCKAYKDYGARGITICERWSKFENFLSDMGPRPIGFSIGRKNNNGNYEPGNCRWENRGDQANNRRSSLMIEHNGETLTMSHWARKIKISSGTFHARMKKGWSMDKILSSRLRVLSPRKKIDIV